jgi:hypothetical protein
MGNIENKLLKKDFFKSDEIFFEYVAEDEFINGYWIEIGRIIFEWFCGPLSHSLI